MLTPDTLVSLCDGTGYEKGYARQMMLSELWQRRSPEWQTWRSFCDEVSARFEAEAAKPEHERRPVVIGGSTIELVEV